MKGNNVIGLIRRVFRAGFEIIERPFDRLFGPQLNPIAQLGALGFFFFWIVAVSGIYLFIFFDTGIERAFQSVEYISGPHWFHAGVMRSLHRYASDLMVVMLFVHMLREFAYDHYRGVRWYSWFTGVPIIWFLYTSGITGYWLVWDKLAQFVAISSSELLDWLPVFGEPIARNFISTGTLTSRFFTLMVFMHIAVPLFLLFIMWLHILRISRPKMNPPRALAWLTLVALVVVSLWNPALSQGAADMTIVPAVGLDWFILPVYPLITMWGHGEVWAFLVAVSVMIAVMPWLPPLRRGKPATVDLEHCNGCTYCAEDCPYEAIRMVKRTDGMPFPLQAQVNPSLCVSCGICAGSCPSSIPFRRTEDLRTGIDLPDRSVKELRDKVTETARTLSGPGPRILVLACEHGAAAGRLEGTVLLPCAAATPPSMIDFILSRDLADGVVVAGCAERAPHNRLGVKWTEERFAEQRDPYLRARVPRERIAKIWASAFETRKAEAEIAAFAARVAAMPPLKKGSAPPADSSSKPAKDGKPTESRTTS